MGDRLAAAGTADGPDKAQLLQVPQNDPPGLIPGQQDTMSSAEISSGDEELS